MQANWVLTDWLAFQDVMHRQVIDLSLSRITEVAQRLNLSTQSASTTITVGGTNGKGSSTAMLSAIYQNAGYRVGWYSSPHLMRYNERVRINGEPVSDALLITAFQAIYAACQGITLTVFEWGTLAALWLFRQQSCDIQILEVGLGGRLDAVNIVDADATLITTIDIDHTALLGNTREAIGYEKAGIFRRHQQAVCADAQPPESLLKHANSLEIDLKRSGLDYQWQVLSEDTWQWQGEAITLTLPKPALKGSFQLANASGVVMLVMQMMTRLPVTQEQIASGLQKGRILGRLEQRQILTKTWLLDVAHNPQSVLALTDYLASLSQPIVAVFSALAEKDIQGMLALIAPYIDVWYIAPVNNPRAASMAQLKTLFTDMQQVQYWFDDIQQAFVAAQTDERAGIRLVFGSFLTVEQGLLWIDAQQQQ